MPNNAKYRLILASKSPRRKELLGWMGVPFDIHTVSLPEVSNFKDPKAVVEDIAKQKGEAVYQELITNKMYDFPLVISADTIVELDGVIYGKPDDKEDARRILAELAGKRHSVRTAVCLIAQDINNPTIRRERVFSCHTYVDFALITNDIMEIYLDSGESLDKAGAYGIQGRGLAFISGIEGSYSNVVGFPLQEFIFELKNFIGHSEDIHGSWRKYFY